MPVLPAPDTASLLAERAVAERIAQGPRNARGLAALATVHLVVACGFGDVAQQLLFASLVALTLGYLQLDFEHDELRGYWLGMGGALFGVVGIGAVLPDGVEGMIFLLPFGLAVMSGALRRREAFAVFLAGAAFCYCEDVYSIFPVLTSPVPTNVSIVITVSVTFLVAVLELLAGHRRTLRALDLINVHSTELAAEAGKLANDRLALEQATGDLERATAASERLRRREARRSAALSAKREDEKALINAIHQDLREPLRGVVSFGQLVERRLAAAHDGAPVMEYIGFAVDGGRRMAVMLDDLLRYAEATSAEQLEPVDLAEVLEGVCDHLHARIEASGGEVVIARADLPIIYGQATQLTQLFLNLIGNALKFARPGEPPQVSVEVHPAPADGVTIAVSDQGIGIPAAQLEQVFGLFNRAHEEEGYEGSGVGLALCRRIAIAHGADLSVASTPGEGTTFSLTFELASLAAVPSRVVQIPVL